MIGKSHQKFEEKCKEYQGVFKKTKNKAIIGINIPTRSYSQIIEEEIPAETILGLMEKGIFINQRTTLIEPPGAFLQVEYFDSKNLMFVIGERVYLKNISDKLKGNYTIGDLV